MAEFMDTAANTASHLIIPCPYGIHASDAGLFVSRGKGRHPSRVVPFFELIFVNNGELKIEEEARGFKVAAGRALFLFANRLHVGTADYLPGLSFYWIVFTLSSGPDTASADSLTIRQLSSPGRPERIQALFDWYLEDNETGRRPQEAANAMLLNILHEVNNDESASDTVMEHSPLAVRAEAFMRRHFGSELSASILARELGCNPDYLNRVFRATYRETLTNAICRHRMVAAKRLLMGSDLNITEIARECGFDDATYFRRRFRQIHAVRPTDFRRLHRRPYIYTE